MDEISARFSYNPETGSLTLKENGKVVGWASGNGYLKVDCKLKKYYAHRVAWFLTYGEWPQEIDHINGDRSDNRLCNLRACTKFENARNSPKRAHSKQPYKGVRWSSTNSWQARIRHNNQAITIGYFATAREAYEEYIFAALELHGDYARLE